MQTTNEVELNFFYLHYNDAIKLKEWAEEAERENSPLCSLHSRHSIISVVFASEALINRVIYEFSIDKETFKSTEKLSLQEKWYIAPLLCRDKDWDYSTYDKSKEPYQSFAELVKIRNWLLHPKVEIYVDAKSEPGSSVGVERKGEDYPWLETLRGELWPQTKIPKNPFECSTCHAEKTIDILDSMTEKLKEFLRGKIYEDWPTEITVRDKNGLHNYKAPIETLWGGYRPK